MAKPRPLTAAECARLTGITVKALRVYEHAGLIKPARSANGYRIYGQKELVRLNAIATLKSLGLTLAQIRDTFEAAAPRLPKVLKMQTPEEERAWSTYYANLPPEEMALHREHSGDSRIITAELLRLMNANADPASEEVQALIERSNDLNARCRFREGYVARLEWNAPLTRKLLALGRRLMVTTAAPAGADLDALAEKFPRYMRAAHEASKAGQALLGLLDEARALLARNERPDLAVARRLAERFVAVCAQHNLGEPVAYARSIVEFGPFPSDLAGARELWGFLADATAAIKS